MIFNLSFHALMSEYTSDGTVLPRDLRVLYLLHCMHTCTHHELVFSHHAPQSRGCPSWHMVLQAGMFWPAVGLPPPPSTSTPPLTLCSTGEGTSPQQAPPPGTGELAMPPTSGQAYTTVLNWTRWTIPRWGEECYRSQLMHHLAEHIEQVILFLCVEMLCPQKVF